MQFGYEDGGLRPGAVVFIPKSGNEYWVSHRGPTNMSIALSMRGLANYVDSPIGAI
jgi:hypothetical protein